MLQIFFYKHIQWTKIKKGFRPYHRQPRKNLHTTISVNKPNMTKLWFEHTCMIQVDILQIQKCTARYCTHCQRLLPKPCPRGCMCQFCALSTAKVISNWPSYQGFVVGEHHYIFLKNPVHRLCLSRAKTDSCHIQHGDRTNVLDAFCPCKAG